MSLPFQKIFTQNQVTAVIIVWKMEIFQVLRKIGAS